MRAQRGSLGTAVNCLYDYIKVTVVYDVSGADLVYTFPSSTTTYANTKAIEHNENLYLPVLGWDSWDGYRMFKSLDGGTTWNAQDTDNDINDTAWARVEGCTAKLGNVLYLAYWSYDGNDGTLKIARFDMDTDTWLSSISSTITRTAGSYENTYSLSLGLRSNGDIICGVALPMENVNGTDYRRAGWVKYSAAASTWGSVIPFNSGVEYPISSPMLSIDSEDRAHFNLEYDWYAAHITLNASDQLGSPTLFNTEEAWVLAVSPLIYFSSGIEYVLVPYTDGTDYTVKYKVGPAADTLIFGPPVNTGALHYWSVDMVEANGVLACVHNGNFDDNALHVYFRSNVGGSWGNEICLHAPYTSWDVSALFSPHHGAIVTVHSFDDGTYSYAGVLIKSGFNVSMSGNASLSGGGAISESGHKGTAGSAAVSGGGALEAAGQVRVEEHEGDAALSGGGSIETSGAKGVRSPPIMITGSGTLAGGGEKSLSGGAAVSGGGNNQVGGYKTTQSHGTASAGVEGAASGSPAKNGSISVSGGGNPEAAGGPGKRGTALVSRGGAARVSGRTGRIGVVSLSGDGGQQAAGRVSREYIPLTCSSSVIERPRTPVIQRRSVSIVCRVRATNQRYQQRAVKVLQQSRIVSLGVEE
ncbi:MAG: hypothetical protein HPY50_04890 [Firmicutes bacterium]|nr:hypothetical protein [Bacillota bacterium]